MNWVNYWTDNSGLWPFLIQYRSPVTGLFQPPDLAAAAPQVDIDFCNERRCDLYPGSALGQEHCDCVLETGQGGMFAIQYESFPPWGAYVAANGDGGNLVGITGDGFIKAFATSDGGMPGELYYFIGPDGGNGGWVMGGTDAIIGDDWIERVCMLQQSYPGPDNPEGGGLSPAYTRYLRAYISVPVTFDSAQPEHDTYECMVSEHYGAEDPATASEFERFVLAKGWGLIRWEYWAKSGTPTANLTDRAPAMDWCWPGYGGAAPGYQLMDARHYMNLHPQFPADPMAPNPSFRVVDAGWPGSVVLPAASAIAGAQAVGKYQSQCTVGATSRSILMKARRRRPLFAGSARSTP
jgi:hypothetical protein